MLRGQHPGADGLVHAFDLRHVDAAAGVADQHGARHLQARDRLPAARRDGARAGREDLPALEQRLDLRVMLELLECLEGRQPRILVIEPDDEADVDAVLVEVIDEAAAIGARIERPAERVLDVARAAPGPPAAATAPSCRGRKICGLERASRPKRRMSCLRGCRARPPRPP